MRVLVVTTWYPETHAPHRTPFVPRHVRAIARHHEVHVIHVKLLDDSPAVDEEFDGVRVTRVGFDPGHPFSLARALSTIRHWARCADVVHTMAFSSALVAAPVVRRLPWVHTEHWNGVLFPEHVNTVWQWSAGLRHVLRLPRVVTGVSTLMTDTLARFARPGAVRLVGNVVDSSPRITPRSDQPLRLVGVGAATEHKGVVLAVETLAVLRSQGHDASLFWAGDGPCREAALERARELGIAEHVDLPGFRNAVQVQEDLAAASVFLLPSKSETFCVAAAEALAAGRPVAMGARGGQRDFVDGTNGRLVEERTAEAFAAAVVDLLSDPGLAPAREMAGAIRSRYGLEAVADDFSTIYARVVCG
ncbi:hypothetical protein CWC38_06415 [Kocuria tytonicola]|nr:hypothetical protein CWC38_06415 [Kocuria tytonicola]